MTYHDTNRYVLPAELRSAIEWVGYSMADDKRRRYFRALLECEQMDVRPTLRNISSCTGIHRTPVERGMSILSAIDIVKMNEADNSANKPRMWTINNFALKDLVNRIDPPRKIEGFVDQEVEEEDYQGNTLI